MKVDVVACLSLLCSVRTSYIIILAQYELMNTKMFGFFQINMMALAYDGPPEGDPLNLSFYEIDGIVFFTRCSLVTNLTLGIMIFYYISNI